MLGCMRGLLELGAQPLMAFSRASSNRRWSLKTLPKLDEGTPGEKAPDIMLTDEKLETLFPTQASFTKLYNGIPYNRLPVCDIKASKNNTIMTVSNYDGTVKCTRSCGVEGFKNARKGTNIAAQATAISLSTTAISKGLRTVRVRVGGLGPGRMSSIKGLQMGGMNIISITDTTKVSPNPPRPRKARRV